MGKEGAKTELMKVVKETKKLGKSSKDIPNKLIISIAEKYNLGGREIMDILDEVWAAA